MPALTYQDAVNEALDRLRTVGYEHGPSFVNHAPMAAEALAHMGYGDDVPRWVEHNLRSRSYHDLPQTRFVLRADQPDAWRAALGDFSRVADWSEMFARELEEAPWRDVLALWWPRLLPGMSAALTHGVIRTAHAVRALAAAAAGHDRLERAELAHGLGYWAARFPTSTTVVPAGSKPAQGDPGAAQHALDALVADASGVYARARLHNPVPLIHAVTAPAAVRLVCAYLPEQQRWPAYLTVLETSRFIQSHFAQGALLEDIDLPAVRPVGELFAEAVEIGDEHAIKLTEVAVRHHGYAPDPRYAAAAEAALRALRRFGV